MKKTAIAAAGALVVMSMLAGCGGNRTEETTSGQVQIQEEKEGNTEQSAGIEEEENNQDASAGGNTDAGVEVSTGANADENASASTDETADVNGSGNTEKIENDAALSADDSGNDAAESEEQEISDKEKEKAIAAAKEAAREALLLEEREMIDTSVPLYGGAHIAVVSKSTDGEFWQLIKTGMEDAVSSVNEIYAFEKSEQITMNFEGADSELDISTQVNTIDAVIAENPDVLCIAAGDMDSCQAQLEAAMENGIPVVAFDSNVSESDMITAYRATDNMEVGRIAAVQLAEEMGEEGAVAVFSAPEKTESAKNRLEGFKQELQNYPEMEIVEVIYLDQVEDMKSAMQSSIAGHPELKGVFCTNADIAEMYLTLETALESRSIFMIGMDATTVQQQAIRDGKQIGVVSQNPHMMGFETIWTALMTTVQDESGAEFSKNKLLQPVWIDLENIDDAEYGKYLY